MTDYLELKNDELNLGEITDQVGSADCGAISLFIGKYLTFTYLFKFFKKIYEGTTRDNMHGRKVTRLEYEAYDSMALKEMKKICNKIRETWPSVKNIAIYHRLGEVQIKKASIIIAISSPHRKDSLEAVNFCINEVKRTVPVWKKVPIIKI